MSTGPFTRTVRRGKNTPEMVLLILISAAIIFYVDIITPLGFAVWILYFFPLFLTIYIKWEYAPFCAAGAFIILTFIGLFLSPRDTSMIFALLNCVFFSLMLIVAAYFIYWMIHFTTRELFH